MVRVYMYNLGSLQSDGTCQQWVVVGPGSLGA